MKTVLFIHQSAELYGSDKTLLQLVTGVNKEKIFPIVILPENGPLSDALLEQNIKVIIAPVLKLYRNIFTPKNILKALKDAINGYRTIKKVKNEYNVDVVYSNTLAVLIGFIFCFFSKTKHVWHVHEILEKPKIITKIYRYLLNRKINTEVIFNSKATQKFWNISTKNTVVWNGIDLYKLEKEINLREKLGFKNDTIALALVGRISRWKGQLLLLEAFNELQKKYSQVKLVYIGSTPPGQEFLLEKLNKKISDLKLIQKVTILPFQKNIESVWEAIDIAVIPSTEPEPFGMVAIEAMMAGKPVLAANHGGLQEIILDSKTGFLFEPNNVIDLQNKLELLIKNKELRETFGKNGLERAKTIFSTTNYISSIENILLAI